MPISYDNNGVKGTGNPKAPTTYPERQPNVYKERPAVTYGETQAPYPALSSETEGPAYAAYPVSKPNTHHKQGGGSTSDLAKKIAAVGYGNMKSKIGVVADAAKDGTSLSSNKKKLVDALNRAGASDAERALVLAIGMQETNHICYLERDAGKSGLSENFGPLNMNKQHISTLTPEVDPQKMNGSTQQAFNIIAKVALAGIRKQGLTAYINQHRGGTSNYGNGDMSTPIQQMTNTILADPALLTDNRRIHNDLNHI